MSDIVLLKADISHCRYSRAARHIIQQANNPYQYIDVLPTVKALYNNLEDSRGMHMDEDT